MRNIVDPLCFPYNSPMIWLILSILSVLQWILLRLLGVGSHLHPYLEVLLSGVAIMGAGFLLSTASEAAQKDISRSFAVALLALIAILPEYAVDVYYAWRGAQDPVYVHYAAANMTGANRLLLGVFWPLVVFLYVFRHRKAHHITLDPSFRLELVFLSLATLVSFLFPVFRFISLWASLVLMVLFAVYIFYTILAERHEPELEGAAEWIGAFAQPFRGITVTLLFVYAGVGILMAAEPFAEGLIASGKLLGISEFFLVQWLAPVASEAPELVVVSILAWQGKSTSALGALVSSKVNQWTLLIAALPIAFSIGLGHLAALPLDPLQVEEIFLTAAQSLFGIALISDLTLTRRESVALLVLFFLQFFIPHEQIRILIAWAYILLSISVFLIYRSHLRGWFRAWAYLVNPKGG